MDIMLKFECLECRKSFTVNDNEVEGDLLSCPHCGADVPVPDDDNDEDEIEDEDD